MNEQDENRLDDFLRNKLGGYRPEPREELWAAIEQRVNQPVVPQARRRFGRWMPVLLSGTVGLLAGWLTEPQFQHNQSITSPTAAVVETPPADLTAPASVGAATGAENQAAAPALPATAGARPAATPADLGSPAPEAVAPATPVAPAAAPVRPLLPAVAAPAGTSLPASPTVAVAIPTQGVNPTQPVTSGSAPEMVSSVAGAPSVAVVFATSPPVRINPPVLEGLIAAEHTVQTTLLDTASDLSAATRRTMALRLEKAELARLQRRVDSLIRILDPEAALAAEQPEKPKPVLQNRWSVVASFTPERAFMGLQGPSGDTLNVMRRNHEEGRGGFNAAVMGEYRVNDRLSVGLGVGYSSYGAQLRVTNRNTHFDQINDTIRTTTTTTYFSVDTVTGTRQEMLIVNVLSPVYNSTGQVIGFTPIQDTTIRTVVDTVLVQNTDVVTTQIQTIKPNLIKRETTTFRLLRPDYRFVTIPLLVRYRLTPEVRGGRWWTDVALGAQFQFFQGGTQLVTADGRNFSTQRIRRSDAPFRPLNVALTGQLAFNYALTSRLTMSLAPSLRWQMQSVYKKETGLKQQPTTAGLQVGARWTF